MLQTFLTNQWNEKFSSSQQTHAINNLENGQILYFPDLEFKLESHEDYFLCPNHADPHSKNISYHPEQHQLWGVQRLNDKRRLQLKGMLARFYECASGLLNQLLPSYAEDVIIGRTSFRPVQISGRKTSYRKDDKRLHVDAFPSAPNQGKRIIRVFCNINPNDEHRVWRVGEPFEQVANRFLPNIKQPMPGMAALLRFLKITKSYRTHYDHYMLHLHDNMKADETYQKEVQQETISFPPNSTWIVQTDQVSHAAMQGQYVLEQTFYLPIKAMQDESVSPLKVLERLLGKKLV